MLQQFLKTGLDPTGQEPFLGTFMPQFVASLKFRSSSRLKYMAYESPVGWVLGFWLLQNFVRRDQERWKNVKKHLTNVKADYIITNDDHSMQFYDPCDWHSRHQTR